MRKVCRNLGDTKQFSNCLVHMYLYREKRNPEFLRNMVRSRENKIKITLSYEHLHENNK